MTNQYKGSDPKAYQDAIAALSPIVENAVYLLSGVGPSRSTAGFHCASRSASSASSSPCRATSLESQVKD